MRHRLVANVGWLVALISCTTSEHSDGGGSHEPELPVIRVTLDGPKEMATLWETVEAIPAPDIEFLALIRPDRNHVSLVAAPVSGVLTRIRPEGHTHRGDTPVVLGVGSQVAGRQVAVMGMQDGTWLPLPRRTQLLLLEDSIGLVEQHGYWLALGAIDGPEAGVIGGGDPTELRFGRDRHTASRLGKVEWIRRDTNLPYYANVAVEFRAPEGTFDSQPGPVTVLATPVGARDSVPAVPATAVVQLGPGTAVFVPVSVGRYEVRWITTGPTLDGMVVVQRGVSPGMSIVVRGLAPLVTAVRDSLARRQTHQ